LRPRIGAIPTLPPPVTGGRTQCVSANRSNELSVGPSSGPITVVLLCKVPEQSVLIAFRFDDRAQYYQLMKIFGTGFAGWITYNMTALSGAAEGQPSLYAVTGVSEGMQDSAQVACVSNYTKTPVALSMPPRGSDPNIVTMWCTDGTRIAPLKFDKKGFAGYPGMPIENGPIYVRYSTLSGGGAANPRGAFVYKLSQRGPYPASDAPFGRALGTKDTGLVSSPLNNEPRGWGPNFHRYTLVDDPLVGPIVLCTAGPGMNVCSSGQTKLDAYFSDAVIGAASPTKPAPYAKSVVYSVLPGLVAPEFRSLTGGASRMIAGAEVQFRDTTTLGVGKANE
jgi:hypothetical protein